MAEEEHDHGYCEAEARAEPEGTKDPSTGFLDEMEGYTISSDYDPPLIPIELIKRLSLKPNEKSHVVVAKGEDGEFYNIGEVLKRTFEEIDIALEKIGIEQDSMGITW